MKLRLFDLTTREESLAWSVDAFDAVRNDPSRFVMLAEGEEPPAATKTKAPKLKLSASDDPLAFPSDFSAE
jgi:hypothetical protein